MIVAVTPAPALDLTQHVGQMRLGESLRVAPPAARPGGKGLNVARVLAARGVPVAAVGPLGGERGKHVSDALSRLAPQVATRWVRVGALTRTSTALVEDGGRVTMLNEVAAPLSLDEHDALRHAVVEQAEAEGPGAIVAICGSWPADTPATALRSMVRQLHEVGAFVCADTSGELLLEAAAAGTDLLKPNIHELAEATGGDGIEASLQTLFDLGAREVLLSKGEDGMSHHTVHDRAGIGARLYRVLTGNPTGAGDAAVAGWLAVAHELGHAPASTAERRRALAAAVTWSASAVLSPVAGELGVDPQSLEADVVFSPGFDGS
ncbi:1-phosphofructokinase family hexose kinase [Galactobacter sp.]|uniref:1-phosphofructokinase family hexose kinase n=1 Tax=Galactobacter sp. TaxID=2676125 RepID=UPI0025C093A9|nr:PfkB family carbohydrate kinase [Galactobacter sp.]